MTPQHAREKHKVRVTVYRQGHVPFRDYGNALVVVRCPQTALRREGKWVPYNQVEHEVGRLVALLESDRLLGRARLHTPDF